MGVCVACLFEGEKVKIIVEEREREREHKEEGRGGEITHADTGVSSSGETIPL